MYFFLVNALANMKYICLAFIDFVKFTMKSKITILIYIAVFNKNNLSNQFAVESTSHTLYDSHLKSRFTLTCPRIQK